MVASRHGRGSFVLCLAASLIAYPGVALSDVSVRPCGSLALHALHPLVPAHATISFASSDPSEAPLPAALFDFDAFALSGSGLSMGQSGTAAEGVGRRLCEVEKRWKLVAEHPTSEDIAVVIPDGFDRSREARWVLLGGSNSREDHHTSAVDTIEDALSEVVIGHGATGNDSGSGDVLASEKEEDAPGGQDGGFETGIGDMLNAADTPLREGVSSALKNLAASAKERGKEYLEDIATSNMDSLIASSVFLRASVAVNIPIPAFPPAFVRPAFAAELILSNNFRYLDSHAEISLGLNFPPAKPVVGLFVTLEGRNRLVGHGDLSRSISSPEMILVATQYALYANADQVKRSFVRGVSEIRSALGSTNTPTRPSPLLRLYAEGFDQEYVSLLDDEWTYVTSGDGSAGASASGESELPSDEKIVSSLRTVGRMLEVTPERRGDGSLVWHYTASSRWTSTKLYYRLSASSTWTWSPDDKHFMPLSTHVVRGGKWNGQRPTQANRDTIDAIHVVYNVLAVKLPRAGGDDANDLLVSEAAEPDVLASDSVRDACSCETEGSRIGAYDPDAWGSQCRDWDRSGHSWCVTSGRCRKYDTVAYRGRLRRRCGLGVWASKVADDAVAAANHHVIEPAREGINSLQDKLSDALTTAEQNLVAAAKRTVRQIESNWREIKATVKETGAFRLAERSWFRGGRRPLRVFQGLAERMREEGFQRRDNQFERALFTTDAMLFRDFTRVLSLREAVFAFAKKNKGASGIAQHLRRILREDAELKKRTRETSTGAEPGTDGRSPTEEEILRSAGLDGDNGDDDQFKFERDPKRNPSGMQANAAFSESRAEADGSEAADNGIRRGAVEREIKRHDGSDEELSDDDALELYSVISEHVVERFDHIRSVASSVASRLEGLGDPEWSSLTASQKDEYRRYYISIRRLTGELHTMLLQINRGDAPLKRALVSGADWLKRKITSSCDHVKARMAVALGARDWGVSSKTFLVTSFGASAKTPALPTLGTGEFRGTMGYSMGHAAIIQTAHLEDPSKTFSSTYSGPAWKVTGSFQKALPTGSTRKFVAFVKREVRHFDNDHYCREAFGLAPCTEKFTQYFIFFPAPFGKFKTAWVPLAVRLILLAAPKLANQAVKLMAAESERDTIRSELPDGGSPDEVNGFFEKIHGVLHGMSPDIFSNPDEGDGKFKVSLTWRQVMNILKDNGAAFVFSALATKIDNQLGFMSFMNQYEMGVKGTSNYMSGTDAANLQVFFKGQFAANAVSKVSEKITSIFGALSKTGMTSVRLHGEFGTLFWIVPPGAAKFVVEAGKEAGVKSSYPCAPGTGCVSYR